MHILAARRFVTVARGLNLLASLALVITLGTSALTAGTVSAEEPSGIFYLPIRYRTQFDNTPYQAGNCGPASLGMVVSAMRDEYVKTTEIRAAANAMQGTTGIWDSGTSLEVLATIGRRYGAIPMSLFDAEGKYHQWTLDEVRAHLRAGYPVIPQVHYVKLPGHEYESPRIDHYIVLIGTAGEDFIYHDPAFEGGAGQSLWITAERLTKAWKAGDHEFAAVAFRPNDALPSLLPTVTPTPPVLPTVTPSAPTPVATPTPPPPSPTPSPSPTPAAPTAESSDLVGRWLGGVSTEPTPSPTPDGGLWPLGNNRSDRAGGISSRGELRPTATPAESEGQAAPGRVPAVPPAAGILLCLPLAHLVQSRIRASRLTRRSGRVRAGSYLSVPAGRAGR